MKSLSTIFLICLVASTPLLASQDGVVVRTATVYAKPSYSSSKIGQIKAGSAVGIESRSGGWEKIASEKPPIQGWVRSHQVREAAAIPLVETGESKSDSRGFLSGLAAFSRKASRFFRPDSRSTSAGTATIGVRGLSAAEIKSAKADFDEFLKMERFASNQKRAGEFARQGGLSAQKVPHISGRQ